MLLIGWVIVAGVLVGIALGGDLRTLSDIRLRWWPLAIIGLALQLVPIPTLAGQLDHWLAVGLLVASYIVLLVFVAMNIRLPGFPVIAVGFALNLLVISINGGMPVTTQALRSAYGPQYSAEVIRLERQGGAKHHVARDDDVLLPLADVIPLGSPLNQVLSVGDIVFMVGVFWVIAAATKGANGRHRMRPRREAGGDLPDDSEQLGQATRGLPDAPDPARPAADQGQ